LWKPMFGFKHYITVFSEYLVCVHFPDIPTPWWTRSFQPWQEFVILRHCLFSGANIFLKKKWYFCFKLIFLVILDILMWWLKIF
jgi:hypothetical protein